MRKAPVAYLISRYPAISVAFIHREILLLRQLGLEIATVSINPAEIKPETTLNDERHAETTTFYVKKAGLWYGVCSVFYTLFHKPAGFFKGFASALWLGGLHPIKSLYHLAYFFEALYVGRWMDAKNANHLHVHFANPASTVGMLTAKIFSKTLSITVHGPDEFYEVDANHLKEKVAAAKFIVCISYYTRSQLMQITPYEHWNKLHVVPLGVDPHHFKPVHKQQENKTFEILCVARLVPVKGQRILIEACKILQSEGIPLTLRFVGDGPDRKALEKMKSETIIFEGSVNQENIRKYYENADLFVLPSFAEGKPVVLMEAMSMEIPCISTWINGTPELIRDSRDGLLVPPSDIHALAEAIKRLYKDSTLRYSLAKTGRYKILSEYDLNKNVKMLLGLILSYNEGA